MKKIVIMLAVGLLSQRIIQAQGTTYVSNLGQTPDGSLAVGRNSWWGSEFITGFNPGGYLLDSIQLGMTNATGNPSGFSVAIYRGLPIDDLIPQTNLCTLTGSLSPIIAGVYTFTTVSNFLLTPSTLYYLVLTAGTTITNGAYEWNYENTRSYNPSDNWYGTGPLWSNEGNLWHSLGLPYYYPQYAITATPVPEPSPSWLLLLGGGVFIYVRRICKR